MKILLAAVLLLSLLANGCYWVLMGRNQEQVDYLKRLLIQQEIRLRKESAELMRCQASDFVVALKAEIKAKMDEDCICPSDPKWPKKCR